MELFKCKRWGAFVFCDDADGDCSGEEAGDEVGEGASNDGVARPSS